MFRSVGLVLETPGNIDFGVSSVQTEPDFKNLCFCLLSCKPKYRNQTCPVPVYQYTRILSTIAWEYINRCKEGNAW